MTASGVGRFRAGVTAVQPAAREPGGYRGKWSTLSNTTLGVGMATIDASIVLISLPDIFRGIDLNPLTPGNTSYFLWLLMGYLLVTAVLVVSFGRLGDIFGRVRISAPFTTGLHQAFDFAIAAMLIAAAASWLRGSHRAEPDARPGAGPGPGGYGHNPTPGSGPGSRNALPDR